MLHAGKAKENNHKNINNIIFFNNVDKIITKKMPKTFQLVYFHRL